MPTTASKKSASSTLAIGSAAPDFSMPADTGETVSLAQFKGKKNVVLYFYPKDDTPGCTIEAKEFRDANAQFEKANTVVIGVSKDDIKSHCKFRDKFQLSFLLASDAESDVCERYGVWVEKNMYGKKYMGIARETFLIGKDGTLKAHWPKVKPEGHAAEVLAAVK
jgi:peroxiredoxin Q/BCP